MNDETRLYGEVTRLVKIVIEGTTYEVPDQLELLRCFQFLNFHISYEVFCWNASCDNCMMNVSSAGGKPERVLGCQVPAEEGMVIEKLPEGVTKP